MQAALRFIKRYLLVVVVVLTNMRFASLVMGCSSPTVHVVLADASAFQLWLHDGMAADARRPAHLMESYVRGRLRDKPGVLEDARLPEAYTTNVGPSIQASEYHFGYAAERLIREHYAATHLQMPTLETNQLLEIVEAAGGNTYAVADFNRDLLIDIGDAHARVIFDVVPPGQPHLDAAKERVAYKQRLLNYAMIGVPKFTLGTAYHGELGVRFGENAPLVKLAWVTTAPGIVQYQWRALQVEERSEEAYGEAYMAGRWRALCFHKRGWYRE